MADLKLHKVNTLPGTLEPDSLYFVTAVGPNGGLFAESYLTDSSGAARLVGSSAMITEVANAAGSSPELYNVADIAARDALSLTENGMVLVTDASADTTVTSGAAMYFYDSATSTYIKVAEYESLDVVVDWADVQSKPTSSVAQIDAAVANSHTHANIAQLDKITENGDGCLLYDGELPQAWTTKDW